jgi:hypothetical protein
LELLRTCTSEKHELLKNKGSENNVSGSEADFSELLTLSGTLRIQNLTLQRFRTFGNISL